MRRESTSYQPPAVLVTPLTRPLKTRISYYHSYQLSLFQEINAEHRFQRSFSRDCEGHYHSLVLSDLVDCYTMCKCAADFVAHSMHGDFAPHHARTYLQKSELRVCVYICVCAFVTKQIMAAENQMKINSLYKNWCYVKLDV